MRIINLSKWIHKWEYKTLLEHIQTQFKQIYVPLPLYTATYLCLPWLTVILNMQVYLGKRLIIISNCSLFSLCDPVGH